MENEETIPGMAAWNKKAIEIHDGITIGAFGEYINRLSDKEKSAKIQKDSDGVYSISFFPIRLSRRRALLRFLEKEPQSNQ